MGSLVENTVTKGSKSLFLNFGTLFPEPINCSYANTHFCGNRLPADALCVRSVFKGSDKTIKRPPSIFNVRRCKISNFADTVQHRGP
jgi:hypothetical protein